MSAETVEIRIKRLRIRCWRRGIKEMDLILGKYADEKLTELSLSELDAFEELTETEDQTLFSWFNGQNQAPEKHQAMLKTLRAFHGLDR